MDGIFGLGGRYQSFFNPNSFLANLANVSLMATSLSSWHFQFNLLIMAAYCIAYILQAGQANNSYGLCLGQFGGYLNMGYEAEWVAIFWKCK